MKDPTPNVTMHVSTAELYDVAEGNYQLSPEQRKHLHSCDYCQLILRAFITRTVGTASGSETRADRKPAA